MFRGTISKRTNRSYCRDSVIVLDLVLHSSRPKTAQNFTLTSYWKSDAPRNKLIIGDALEIRGAACYRRFVQAVEGVGNCFS